MDLAGKRVLILGLGISGRSAANFCAARGARVLAADEAGEDRLRGLDELAPGIELRTGSTLPDPTDYDLVVPSPGIAVERYADRARAVLGDIELAGRFLEVPIVAVTGTNGKTTTVSLVEMMLRGSGLRARAAGNVGTPALSLVGEPLDVAVLEVSSFQLEAVERFAPRVAAVLNITPDHLDRHRSFEAYTRIKQRIFENQGPGDTAVLNFDDPASRALAPACKGAVSFFSTKGPVERGVCLDGGVALVIAPEGIQRVALDDLPVAHGPEIENLLASLAVVSALGVDPARALAATRDFIGLPHRCELVATQGGVRFVNDSKATNPGAAARSLRGFDAPVHWIAGGRDKGLDFATLADIAAERAKSACFYGETAQALETAMAGRIEVVRVTTLEQAITHSAERAEPGDVVLLAPACASFDQFASFEQRGERFRSAVHALATERKSQ